MGTLLTFILIACLISIRIVALSAMLAIVAIPLLFLFINDVFTAFVISGGLCVFALYLLYQAHHKDVQANIDYMNEREAYLTKLNRECSKPQYTNPIGPVTLKEYQEYRKAKLAEYHERTKGDPNLMKIVAPLTLFIVCLFTTNVQNSYAQSPSIIQNSFTPTNLCHSDNTGTICETFHAPNVLASFTHAQYIENSPIDPRRQIENLPTFALAAYHHWLFTQQLFRAQRQYAGCVERIKVYQELLGIYPLIDDEKAPLYTLINSIREYEIPFNPLGTNYPDAPPTKEIAIQHALAAVYSNNLTVYNLGLCEQGEALIKGQYLATLKKKVRR